MPEFAPQRLLRALTSHWLVLALAVLITGCGGGNYGSDPDQAPVQAPASNPPTAAFVGVVARTGPIVAVRVGETAILDGSKSVAQSGDPLSFSWSFAGRPGSSRTVLQDASTESPYFVADAPGAYPVQLVVSAGGITSRRDVQLVVASVAPDRFTGPHNHQGLSSDCVNCHSDDFTTIASKALNHVATSNLCETCHSPVGFDIMGSVDHTEVFGACSECHNGRLAIGKSQFHVPTAVECDSCHNTDHFLELEPDGSFDHSNIARECSGCHNGGVSIGKTPSPPHPVTDAECGACHTTDSFLDAFPDHTGPEVVGNRCDSCHGVTATGQSFGHPTTFVDCATCHSIATFSLGGIFNHRLVDASIQPCESCHNDNTSINAPAKSSAVPSHPATSSDCGNCHNTESFTGAFTDHTGIVDNCAACHGVTASGKSPNHMPTSEDCSICHTPGTFTTGTYDHFGVINGCESCHDNVITIGKLFNHIPTTEDCAVCHNTTDFRDAVFDHQGIDTSDCASCHDMGISTPKSANHLPTVLDCSSCHNIFDYDTFAGIVFNHAGIDPNDCAACHNTGIATPKDGDHIPAPTECSTCHDSTDLFSSTTFLVLQHPDIDRGCEGCHIARFFPARPDLVKAADHLPTTQDCSVCHVNTTFTLSIFSHDGITGNCASCHDGSSGHAAQGALGDPATPVHQNTSSDCSVCHNTTNFADAFVDHSGPDVVGRRCDSCHNGTTATGKNAIPNHVVTSQDCAVCHVPGGTFAPAVFNHTGITSNCASCHNGTDATGTAAKVNPPHIPITQDCSACHTPTSFAGAHFDHTGITSNCASCHNGSTATGKSNNHVPTNADCSNCHVTTGFLPGTFDHAGIQNNCASCHDAGFATPKSNNHLPTGQDCGVCHNTTAFAPATFDHTGIVDNCASCHGVTARGMSDNHIATALDCSACHTTATFAGGSWDHQGITDGCSSCHDGNIATGSEPQGLNDHFVTTSECNLCHNTQRWAPIAFTHPPGSGYPGDHSRNIGCRTCHTGNDENIAFRWPQYAPFCAACHANDFKRKGDHIGGENGTVEQNKDCSGGGRGCHRVSSREW